MHRAYLWHVKVDNHINRGNIKATGCNVGRHLGAVFQITIVDECSFISGTDVVLNGYFVRYQTKIEPQYLTRIFLSPLLNLFSAPNRLG